MYTLWLINQSYVKVLLNYMLNKTIKQFVQLFNKKSGKLYLYLIINNFYIV